MNDLSLDLAGSVSLLFDRVKLGETDAFRQLCDRYLPDLTRTADRKITPGEDIDTDAIANSVMLSLWRAVVERGHFQDVQNRDSLRRVLATIVHQKVRRHRRDATRQKRDRRTTVSDSFETIPSTEPGSEILLEIRDTIDQFLSLLLPEQRDMVNWQIEGCTNPEIASRLGCSLRTVERHFLSIRQTWTARLADLGWDRDDIAS